jgi:hypothetical protein
MRARAVSGLLTRRPISPCAATHFVKRNAADIGHAFDLAHREHGNEPLGPEPDRRLGPSAFLADKEAVLLGELWVEAQALGEPVRRWRDELAMRGARGRRSMPEGRVYWAGSRPERSRGRRRVWQGRELCGRPVIYKSASRGHARMKASR